MYANGISCLSISNNFRLKLKDKNDESFVMAFKRNYIFEFL